MNSYLNHITEKLFNRRNALFLLLFCILQIVFYIAVHMDGWQPGQFSSFYRINLKIGALWTTAVICSELSSGLIAKQLTNGMSRKLLSSMLIYRTLVHAMLYYIAICLFAYGIILIQPESAAEYNRILGFPVLGMIFVMFLSLLLSLHIRRTIPALVVTYFAGQMDMIPARLILKHGNPDYTLLCPYYTAEELLNYAESPLYAAKVLAVFVYLLLLIRLSYRRSLRMDFL